VFDVINLPDPSGSQAKKIPRLTCFHLKFGILSKRCSKRFPNQTLFFFCEEPTKDNGGAVPKVGNAFSLPLSVCVFVTGMSSGRHIHGAKEKP